MPEGLRALRRQHERVAHFRPLRPGLARRDLIDHRGDRRRRLLLRLADGLLDRLVGAHRAVVAPPGVGLDRRCVLAPVTAGDRLLARERDPHAPAVVAERRHVGLPERVACGGDVAVERPVVWARARVVDRVVQEVGVAVLRPLLLLDPALRVGDLEVVRKIVSSRWRGKSSPTSPARTFLCHSPNGRPWRIASFSESRTPWI